MVYVLRVGGACGPAHDVRVATQHVVRVGGACGPAHDVRVATRHVVRVGGACGPVTTRGTWYGSGEPAAPQSLLRSCLAARSLPGRPPAEGAFGALRRAGKAGHLQRVGGRADERPLQDPPVWASHLRGSFVCAVALHRMTCRLTTTATPTYGAEHLRNTVLKLHDAVRSDECTCLAQHLKHTTRLGLASQGRRLRWCGQRCRGDWCWRTR